MHELVKTVARSLRQRGFKGSGQNFRKVEGDFVYVVNVQGGRAGDGFHVNLGLQPLFIPTVSDEPPDPAKVGGACAAAIHTAALIETLEQVATKHQLVAGELIEDSLKRGRGELIRTSASMIRVRHDRGCGASLISTLLVLISTTPDGRSRSRPTAPTRWIRRST
jgi:hypothetical protein